MLHPYPIARSRRGFTLAEMMVVIVIIGLLATLVVPNVIHKYGVAAVQAARTDLRTLHTSLNEYAVTHAAQYPDSLDALVTPDAQGHTIIEARALPRDPWGSEYVYEPPGRGTGETRPHLVSWGPDRQPGGGDDLSNWDDPKH